MNFVRELDVVREFLAENGFRAAVVGGVALSAYGHPRVTLDLDIVSRRCRRDEVRGYFENAGLEERWHELTRIR